MNVLPLYHLCHSELVFGDRLRRLRNIKNCLSFIFPDKCSLPLGMQDGRITHSHVSATSMHNIHYAPWNGRLQEINHGSVRGAWIARVNNRDQWVQIDLGTNTRVKAIATQGRYDANQWVTQYKLSYGPQSGKFIMYKEGKSPRVRRDLLKSSNYFVHE